MEEGSFFLIGTHTQVVEHPWIKAEFQEIFLDFFWISLSIVISGQVLKR